MEREKGMEIIKMCLCGDDVRLVLIFEYATVRMGGIVQWFDLSHNRHFLNELRCRVSKYNYFVVTITKLA